MPVPSGIIFAWPLANEDIVDQPGWSRATALDGKFPHIATGDTAGTTGGGVSHSHNSAANHGHTCNAHSHTVSGGAASAGIQRANAGTLVPATTTHTHGNSTSASTTDTITPIAIVSEAETNLLPTMAVIWIASDGTGNIPPGAYAYFDGATLPTGWTQPTGGTSPVGNFLRGEPAGWDAPNFYNGGMTTHVHPDSHAHTTDGHGHAAANSAVNTGAALTKVDLTSAGYARDGHKHAVTIGSQTVASAALAGSLPAADGFPKWEKLLVIENTTGVQDTPQGVIGLWLGTIANIPTGWVRKTSTQDFIWSAANAGEIGATGGATTHTHADESHSHTGLIHTHSGLLTGGNADSVCYSVAGTGGTRSTATHTHAWAAGGASNTVTSTDSVSWSACAAKAAYPSYIEVILLKYRPTGPAPAFCAHAGI
jgi:hypothetical protein